MPVPFAPTPLYQSNHATVGCTAFAAADQTACRDWLAGPVRKRVYDLETLDSFADDLKAVIADGFDSSNLARYLNEPLPIATMGDIGEGIADLFLSDHLRAQLPITRRDLRTPKGSLPGADLCGFVPDSDGNGGVRFLFGEVKASAQTSTPPSVMAATGTGMVAQLKRIGSDTQVQRTLMMYLKTRNKDALGKAMFTAAIKRKFLMVGVLVRDTDPDVRDVEAPAKALSEALPDSDVSLFVLHIGLPSPEWLTHCKPS